MTLFLDHPAAAPTTPTRVVTTLTPNRPGWPQLRQIRTGPTVRFECSCGTPLGAARRQARDLFAFHAPTDCPDGPRLPH
jgi:hypothetical protein